MNPEAWPEGPSASAAPDAQALREQVQAVLADGGALSQALPGFQPRQAQRDMAQAVAQVVHDGGALVVEAGTGVGKTFAYLVPVLLSGQRALISTATKALQDQLFARDLPRLLQALNLPLRVALLKGRSSYLCLHRMQQARHQHHLQAAHHLRLLARVETWAPSTHSGDLAEVPGLDESSPLWPWVSSTRDNCLGSACPQQRQCHVSLARKEAMAADLVVINHHLFFADLAVRESGVAELLPLVQVTVFDEAHQLNETGVQFLGQELSTHRLLEFTRDLLAAGLQFARGLQDWAALASALEKATRDWRLAAGQHPGAVRLRWTGAAPQTLDEAAWTEAMARLAQALAQAEPALDMMSELSPDFGRLFERARELRSRIEALQAPLGPDVVRWAEVSAQLRVVQAPLDVGATFARLLAERPGAEPPAPDEDDPQSDPPDAPARPPLATRAWVFTSATLGDDERLAWFTEPCGLQQAQVLRVGSPFDYARQAALYVPADLPRPDEPGHTEQVAQLAVRLTAALGGRTLVLCTSLQAMRHIGATLQAELGEDGQVEVLVQGETPKARLMARFRQADAQGQRGCVLVASATFWEGFDVPGEALQLVLIDKLPFPSPGDPVHQARSERLMQQGRQPFSHLALPQAAVSLRQGAGRLIRHEHDRGMLVIADKRLVTMGYGRRLLSALPPMQSITSQAQALAWLAQLRQPREDQNSLNQDVFRAGL